MAMGFSFRKRIKIGPGITLNVSKSGLSTTIGPNGAKLTVGGKRRPRVTTSISGTGVSFSHSIGDRRRIVAPPPRRRVGSLLLVLVLLLGVAALSLLASALFGR